jgi:phosphatidylglycerol:prolipoprotein diacylglycerol transferase
MLPYYPEPILHWGPFRISAFGVLVALAVFLGGRTMLIRAHRRGIPAQEMFQFCFWVYVCGMLSALFTKTVMDDPAAFLANPARIFHLGLGIRSLGGIIGGLAGGVAWCLFRRLSFFEAFRRLDIVAYALPFAWMLGRLGCAIAHDHRGLPSTSWIAVKFPEGPRFDLGLIEFLFLIPLAIGFRILDRKPRPVGFYFGLYAVVYGGFRIWLDTLHIQPLRFYGGAAGVLIGLLGWIAMWVFERSRSSRTEPAPAAV